MPNFYQNHKTAIWIVVGILLFALVGLFVAWAIKSIDHLHDKPKLPPDTNNANPTATTTNGTPIDPLQGYLPSPLANELVRVLRMNIMANWYGVSPDRCKAYHEACKITDNQLIAVCLEFRRLHPSQISLREAINATWMSGCSAYDGANGSDWEEVLLQRLDDLHIP